MIPAGLFAENYLVRRRDRFTRAPRRGSIPPGIYDILLLIIFSICLKKKNTSLEQCLLALRGIQKKFRSRRLIKIRARARSRFARKRIRSPPPVRPGDRGRRLSALRLYVAIRANRSPGEMRHNIEPRRTRKYSFVRGSFAARTSAGQVAFVTPVCEFVRSRN